ncbi:unnamed protein product, partial [Mycena citricolor]
GNILYLLLLLVFISLLLISVGSREPVQGFMPALCEVHALALYSAGVAVEIAPPAECVQGPPQAPQGPLRRGAQRLPLRSAGC